MVHPMSGKLSSGLSSLHPPELMEPQNMVPGLLGLQVLSIMFAAIATAPADVLPPPCRWNPGLCPQGEGEESERGCGCESERVCECECE